MTAATVIDEIKHLSPAEQVKVIQFAFELARTRALTAQELQLAIHVGSGGSPTPAADSADTTTPVVVVKASDYCYCGSEDDTSVRYKQPHLSWCKKSPSTAPSSTATNPPSAGHKLAIIE